MKAPLSARHNLRWPPEYFCFSDVSTAELLMFHILYCRGDSLFYTLLLIPLLELFYFLYFI